MIYAIRTRYPNVKIIYNSTKGYMYAQGSEAGSLSSPGGPVEPWNHDIAWSVKWLIEDQINGDPTLNYDPARGPVTAPWLSWGPYFWTYGDGTSREYDGFTWTCADLGGDHLHPSDSGCSKYSDLLMNFFKTDSTTTPWFLTSGAPPPPPPPPSSGTTVTFVGRDGATQGSWMACMARTDSA